MSRRSAVEGRVAVVTGATRGIGRAVALALAREGARVALLARTADALGELQERTGGWGIACDVTDPAALAQAASRIEELAGEEPELVVAAAGVFHLSPVDRMPLEELEANLAVNLRGSILTVQTFLPAMRRRGRGLIVQVGSVAGRRPLPDNGAYAASKYGLRGFHEVLLEELRGSGVRATLLEPAATDTPIWDPFSPDDDPGLPGRDQMLRPEDVAEAVLFAATRREGVQVPFLPVERS